MDLRHVYEEGVAAVTKHCSVDGVFRVVDLFGAVFTCLLIGLCVARLCELYPDRKNKPSPSGRHRDKISWIVILVSYNLCVICVLIADNAILYADLTPEQDQLVRKLSVFSFFLGKYFSYVVLFKCAERVLNKPPFLTNVGLQQMKKLTRMALPILSMAIYGICATHSSIVPVNVNDLVAWLSVVADASLSTLVLGLFLWPAVETSCLSSNVDLESNESTIRTVKRNLALGAVAIVSTVIAMVLVGFLTYLCGEMPTMSNFRRLSAQVSLDVKINQICVHAMTTVWIPIWMKKKMAWHSTSVVGFKAEEGKIDENSVLKSFLKSNALHSDAM